MFNFKRKDNVVQIEVEAKSNVSERWYQFSFNCNDAVYADLLVKSFGDNLTQKIKQIKEEAYKQGFKDAKAKRRHETWFGGHF